jgi:protein transport protein SEC61 subunit gamma-like protein
MDENSQAPEEKKEEIRLEANAAPAEPAKETPEVEAEAEEEVKAEEAKPAGQGFKLPSFNLQGIPAKIMGALREYRRVIIVSKKPNIEEITEISKIAGIGIAIMGLIGFVIQIISQLIMRGA